MYADEVDVAIIALVHKGLQPGQAFTHTFRVGNGGRAKVHEILELFRRVHELLPSCDSVLDGNARATTSVPGGMSARFTRCFGKNVA